MPFPFRFEPTVLQTIYQCGFKAKAKAKKVPLHIAQDFIHEMLYLDYGRIDLKLHKKRFLWDQAPDNPLLSGADLGPVETISLSAGDCIFIQGGIAHSFCGHDDVPFDYLNIMFSGALPDIICQKKIRINRHCHELMKRLREESSNAMEYYEELSACLLSELLILLIRQENREVPKIPLEPAYQEKYHSDVVRRAMDIINKNYNTPLHLKMLSKATGVSIPHLRFLLKRETGKSFTSLVHEKRIVTAKYLLREGNLSPSGIAQAIGYPSLTFFYRLFKRMTGMTPAEYSKTIGGK